MITEKFVLKEFEPKRNNRFILEFPKEFEIQDYAIQKINRPKIVGYQWQNFEIELLDLIEPSTSSSVIKMIDFCKKSKDKDKRTLFSFSISSLDPTGVKVEVWKIDVSELISVDFGIGDYGNDELQSIKIVLKPKNCKLLRLI